MTDEEKASMVAELESTKSALQAARKELELAKVRENKLLIALKSNSNTLAHAGGQSSSMRRYAILVTIGALAAWQVYLTLKLQVLLT